MVLLQFVWWFLVMAVLFAWLRYSFWALSHIPCALGLLLCWLPSSGPAHGAGDEYHYALQERMLLFTEVQDG